MQSIIEIKLPGKEISRIKPFRPLLPEDKVEASFEPERTVIFYVKKKMTALRPTVCTSPTFVCCKHASTAEPITWKGEHQFTGVNSLTYRLNSSS
jgi:hypothetical protein